MIEALTGAPAFLTLGAWEVGGRRYEIAGRRKLDSRQVLPWFEDRGELVVGVLERERPSRALRGAPLLGLESIGFDFGGVDEAADIRSYGRALFTERTRVVPDDSALQIALPSWARSIGYLTELALPLLLKVQPPPARELAVAWGGAAHRILFRSVAELRAQLDSGAPCGEEVLMLLDALQPPLAAAAAPGDFVPRLGDVWSAAQLATSLGDAGTADAARQVPVDALAFLKLSRARHGDGWVELVTPSTGVAVSLVPYLRGADGRTYVLLWNELRPAALERRVHQPLFDLPVPLRYANATGFYVADGDGHDAQLLLSRIFAARVRSQQRLGPPAEPDNSLSSEVRHRYACELDGPSLPPLPEGAFLIELGELRRAVADGLVRDPVVIGALLRLGHDPFTAARAGDPPRRRAYLDRMTEGSQVQRNLRTYSSIESEQLRSPTYARVMTLLQHEFGLRIVYPKVEKDRSFFKAAYRVFMAADRGEDRALQGLHFSHDCFHFALGNYTPPAMPDFARWFVSGEPPPAEPAPVGPAWEDYARALKQAENEATFFSFWTLYQEHLPLARHVGKLTFYEAMRDLGYTTREAVWPLYLQLVDDATLPAALAGAPPAAAALFEYMRGFRDYQLGDIRTAWKFAVKEPYRSYAIRFGIYESDLARYLANVTTFCARLAAVPPGLNPLLAACADVRVELALRVWDVMKGLRLARGPAGDARPRLLDMAEATMQELEHCRDALGELRATIHDAELTSRNELANERIAALAARVGALRSTWWDRLAATGWLPASTIDDERVRELPR